jgi:hypothetical protein
MVGPVIEEVRESTRYELGVLESTLLSSSIMQKPYYVILVMLVVQVLSNDEVVLNM